MLLSILVPTLEVRKSSFEGLAGRLRSQIASNRLGEHVELIYLRDNGERSIGSKRNDLLSLAAGDYVAFVDDDDDISDHYVARICHALQNRPEVDCIGLRGSISFRGMRPTEFVHSIRYSNYFSKDGVYYRPPYHLNPMRRSVASAYRFADVNDSEYIDWALRIQEDQTLRTEIFIDEVLYYYRSRRYWKYQLLLDKTEVLRHSLGLRMPNRLRFAVRHGK